MTISAPQLFARTVRFDRLKNDDVRLTIRAVNFLLLIVLAVCVIGQQSVAQTAYEEHASDYEAELLQLIQTVQTGQLEAALKLTEEHIQTYPESRTAYLIKGDILMAMSSELNHVGANVSGQLDVLEGLKHQLKNRWSHSLEHAKASQRLYPESLIDMGQHQHVLVGDLPAGRLYLYKNTSDGPILIRDYYMSVGTQGYGKQVEGDNKTPVGVYSIYQYIDPKRLPDLYGDGAFPVDYPNIIDKYHDRTGYGIWLHGTPSITYARAPLASEGCFVLSNEDLLDIAQFIDVETRTPVILSDSVRWVSKEELSSKRQDYLAILDSWKSDWESIDTSAYLSHYSSENFNLGKANYQRWSDAKKDTNSRKTFIQVDMDIESLFLYPGEQDMFVVTYTQRYLSNNYSSQSNKEQYWQKDANGKWRIIYEG